MIAFANNRNNDIINVQIGGDGYQDIKLDRDPPQLTPTAITKSFIEAFINNDFDSMIKLTSNGSSIRNDIKHLEQVRDKALNAFNNITDYKESIDGAFAGVWVKFKRDKGEAWITFGMMRHKHLWIIHSII